MKTAHDIVLKPVISKKAIVTLTKDSKEIEFFNSMV